MNKLYITTLAVALAGGALMTHFNAAHKAPAPSAAASDCFTADTAPQKQFGISENPDAQAGQAYLYHARATKAADGSVMISSDEIRHAAANGNGADTKVTKTIAFGTSGGSSATRTVEELQTDGSWKAIPALSLKGSISAVFQQEAGKSGATVADYTFKEYLQPAELVLSCKLPAPKS